MSSGSPRVRAWAMIAIYLVAIATVTGGARVALRYFNAAGADQEGQIGEDHNPETHLIPLIVQAALGRRFRIDVFGTDYSTPDGTAVRDYVHVVDLANAHVLALRHLLKGEESSIESFGRTRILTTAGDHGSGTDKQCQGSRS